MWLYITTISSYRNDKCIEGPIYDIVPYEVKGTRYILLLNPDLLHFISFHFAATISELWKRLEALGLSEKMVRRFKNLYNGHRRKVKTLDGLTEWIDCRTGVKQGCVLSSLLFSLCESLPGNLVHTQNF